MLKHLVPVAGVVAAILCSHTAMADPMKTFEGRKLFQSLCSVCHGAEGKGDGPLTKRMDVHPADLTSARTRARSDEELLDIIAGVDNHQPSRVMPRWGKVIRDTDIEAILAYVRFLQRSKHRLEGDPVVGRKIYQDYCVVCHGEGGRGDGIKADLLPLKPADHTNAARMDKLSNQELRNVILKGGAYMPSWSNTLSPSEVNAVIAYIRLLAFN
ncbi:MAG: c-type cytochrome [Gammaproteobacteria bacterium]|nr:c-type cytochrome [Gammaproteobacteria bacterium]